MSIRNNFMNYLENNMSDKYEEQPYINITKMVVIKNTQFFFNDITKEQVFIIVRILTNNSKVLSFINSFSEGQNFTVRFSDYYTQINIGNGDSQSFFKQTLRWFENDIVIFNYDNDLDDINKLNNVLSTFSRFSIVSYAPSNLDINLNNKLTNLQFQVTCMFTTKILYNGLMRYKVNKNQINEYKTWMTKSRRDKYGINSVEISNIDSVVISTRKET